MKENPDRKSFMVRVRSLAMCRVELSAVIIRLISQCARQAGAKDRDELELASAFPCSPVNRECLSERKRILKKDQCYTA